MIFNVCACVNNFLGKDDARQEMGVMEIKLEQTPRCLKMVILVGRPDVLYGCPQMANRPNLRWKGTWISGLAGGRDTFFRHGRIRREPNYAYHPVVNLEKKL